VKVTNVLPGCFHLQGPTVSALLGSPPEILKHLLRQKLQVPRVGILPDVTDIDGVSQIAFEFLGYWFLFVDQGFAKGERFRIIGHPASCESLKEILRLTLLGPSREEMKRWGLSKSRIEMLADMSDGMALQKDGRVLQVEELFDFIHFPETGDRAVPLFADSAEHLVRPLGGNRFEVIDPEGAQVLDLRFDGEQVRPLVDLSGPIERPEKLRLKVMGCYSGFDPAGPTTGILMWVNSNAFLVDVPSGVSRYLSQVGVSKDQITAVIQTHIHDDHSALSEMVLTEHAVTVISTLEVYESAVAKVAHTIGESPDLVRHLIDFIEIIPGKTYSMFGAQWEFFYTIHSIPTFGFRVTVLDGEGKPHTILHSSDLTHFKSMDSLAEKGVVSREHVQRMKSLVRGDERLATLDAGGGMIHGEPADWDGAIARYPNTEFLFYHVNPSKVDAVKYQVATPGWGKTLLPAASFPQSVLLGVLQGLKLFEVKDPEWINVILSQGQVVEYPAGVEVVTKGRVGDSFHFILNGVLDVLDPEHGREPLLATLESGDFFGEMSIIRKDKTNATVVSRTPVVLFKLRGDLFLEFVEKNNLGESFQNLWKRRPLIETVSIFRSLDPAAKHEISLRARHMSFQKDETIVRQGGKTDEFYIITSGQVRISRTEEGGREAFAVTLGAGDFFGENVAMGYTDRRNASVTALTDLQTLVLSGGELRDLAKRMPILRHKLHLVMKDRGVPSKELEMALQGQTNPR